MNSNKYTNYFDYLIKKLNINSLLDLKNKESLTNYSQFLVSITDFMLDYINSELLQLMYYDLYEEVYITTYDLLHVQYIENNLLSKLLCISETKAYKLFCLTIKLCQNMLFKFYIPKRSYSKTYTKKSSPNKESYSFNKIKTQLNYLKNIPQPEQRSDEWYIFRGSALTASNIYKIFVSDYSQSQLIIEKSEPVNVNKYKNTNLSSPMHHGQKYEPVSILYYEFINNTRVSEFGCVKHSKYSYIAASPDGIICDENSPLYGRMLEIKNVVSREISGIPKMDYWIQMQLQMEVCDLNECDFLETKFTEYLTLEDYLDDISNHHRGFIMQFCNANGEVHYEYPPFAMSKIDTKEYHTWIEMQLIKNSTKTYVRNIYWKLEVISCVLVLRNKLWFKNIQPSIEIFWNNLIEEKESGTYVERISKKQKMKYEEYKEKSDFPNVGCLIDVQNL
jgi:putative phage-type endonuclease